MLLNVRVAAVLAEQPRISVRPLVDEEPLVGSPVGRVDRLLKIAF